ncbi:hypothetical protein ACVWXP_007487 [Bradyrhizobium sp. USDA 4463]
MGQGAVIPRSSRRVKTDRSPVRVKGCPGQAVCSWSGHLLGIGHSSAVGVDGSGLARRIFTSQDWSEQPCVRPVCAIITAGHNALRGSGPAQQHAFELRSTSHRAPRHVKQTGSPSPQRRSTEESPLRRTLPPPSRWGRNELGADKIQPHEFADSFVAPSAFSQQLDKIVIRRGAGPAGEHATTVECGSRPAELQFKWHCKILFSMKILLHDRGSAAFL